MIPLKAGTYMSISFDHTMDLKQEPRQVFAILDDVSLTPKWLAQCAGVEKLTGGKNRVGTKLRYAYEEGSQSGTLDAEITARTPDKHLTFHHSEKMAEVTVDYRITKTAAGSHLEIHIEVTPISLTAKLMSPLIRNELPAKATAAMKKLRALIVATKA
jgi:hypothetical protein